MNKSPIIRPDVSIKPYTTFNMGGKVSYFAKIAHEDELRQITQFANDHNLPLFPLGGGSNLVVSDTDLSYVVAKIEIKGISIRKNDSENSLVTFGAGEFWEDCVTYAVNNGLSGIEALTAIPGTIGAAPVQNIGAYGTEISDVLEELEAYDSQTRTFVTLSRKACDFGYRDSVFKKEKGRYIISSVTLRLTNGTPSIPSYEGVRDYFKTSGEQITLHSIRNAITHIRWSKLPHPETTPNVGSLFKNPVVSNSKAKELHKKFENMPSFPLSQGTKIPAGWLIEKAGLKGADLGGFVVYKKNALVLTNPKGATYSDFLNAKKAILDKVSETFGILLEQEPETLI